MSLDPGVPDVGLSVTVQRDGVVVRLVAAGVIDFASTEVLRESLSRALDRSPSAVVVDMAGDVPGLHRDLRAVRAQTALSAKTPGLRSSISSRSSGG